jgi:hypothetical protein
VEAALIGLADTNEQLGGEFAFERTDTCEAVGMESLGQPEIGRAHLFFVGGFGNPEDDVHLGASGTRELFPELRGYASGGLIPSHSARLNARAAPIAKAITQSLGARATR